MEVRESNPKGVHKRYEMDISGGEALVARVERLLKGKDTAEELRSAGLAELEAESMLLS